MQTAGIDRTKIKKKTSGIPACAGMTVYSETSPHSCHPRPVSGHGAGSGGDPIWYFLKFRFGASFQKTRVSREVASGYTLVEMAIVLAAAAVILGTIWAAAGSVSRSASLAEVTKQVMTVVQNIRTFYGPRAGTAGGLGSLALNCTGALDNNNRNVIPIEMRSNRAVATSAINHALGSVTGNSNAGSFRVRCTDDRNFEIWLSNLKREDCIRFMMSFPVLMPELGVTMMRGQAGGVINIDARNIANPGGGVTLPLSPAAAAARCTSATNNGVRLGFRMFN